jgi:hypothetical protein
MGDPMVAGLGSESLVRLGGFGRVLKQIDPFVQRMLGSSQRSTEARTVQDARARREQFAPHDEMLRAYLVYQKEHAGNRGGRSGPSTGRRVLGAWRISSRTCGCPARRSGGGAEK